MKNLELTVTELRDIPLKLNQEIVNVRYVPERVSQTANQLLESGDSLGVINYVNSAFYIYRGCVAGYPYIGAPHVWVNGFYEWPEPVRFDWGNVQAVTTAGNFFPTNTVKIITSRTEKVSGRNLTEVEDRLLNLDRTFKFKIPSIEKVGLMIDGMGWQETELRWLAEISRNLQKIDKDTFKDWIGKFV